MEVHPAVRIGHVHLRVADIERSRKFYRDLLGFHETTFYDADSAFFAAGAYHHHIAVNTWASQGGKPPPKGSTSLYHFAILYPNRKELAKAVKRLLDAKWPIDGASDHGVSEAVYLRDPDDNGIELYRDRPQGEWVRDVHGRVSMPTKPLDLDDLLAELTP